MHIGAFRTASTSSGQAHHERLGGLGVGCAEEAGWKPACTQEGAGTAGWWKRTWGAGGWLLHPGVWFDTGRRGLWPGSP